VDRALETQPSEELVRGAVQEVLSIADAHLIKRRLMLTRGAHGAPLRGRFVSSSERTPPAKGAIT
jgi:hypothetical protein